MIWELDDGNAVIGHLGMSGRMLLGQGWPAVLEPHDHLIFEAEDGWCLRFNDARRFGMMDLWPLTDLDAHKLLKGLGPEPLGNDFNGPSLAASLKGKKTSIKAALLDQKVVAGLGNIYVSEALFRAGISPKRLAKRVQGDRAEKLAAAVKAVLNDAIAAGGSSLRDYVQTDGELGYFQKQWRVYEREGKACWRCNCDAEKTKRREAHHPGRALDLFLSKEAEVALRAVSFARTLPEMLRKDRGEMRFADGAADLGSVALRIERPIEP